MGGGQRAVGASRGLSRQRYRALQERRRRTEAAASLRSAGGPLELVGDLLIWVPAPLRRDATTTVGVELPIGHLRQRKMHRLALLHRCRPVQSQAHQGMTKRDALADCQQTFCLGACRRRNSDAESLGHVPHQQGVADRFRGRDQQQQASLLRKRPEPLLKAVLDPPRQRLRAQQSEPARQMRCVQPPRQLKQRQRIPLVSATIRSRTRSSSRNRTVD